MPLVERDAFMALLHKGFNHVKQGEGHCILLSGEAGIGKSSLVRAFCEEMQDTCTILQGLCDALYTPRPLAPLYDIAPQISSNLLQYNSNDRAALFADFLSHVNAVTGCTIMVFEDMHWADEATLDFIKFFARRITRTRCLFILTYRDDEVHAHHALKSLPGQLPSALFTRIPLAPLSKPAVEQMAKEKGYNGGDVYSITGGNPFYVTEILAGYSPGVPDNIKDAVIAVYSRQPAATQQAWDILSIAPAGLGVEYLAAMLPGYESAISQSLEAKILLVKDGRLQYKHELYRRAIEANLTPLARITLNKKMLSLFLPVFAENGEVQRIIHHAKNAGDNALVIQYAPIAAQQAAAVGAHAEACMLYATAIDYYKGDDNKLLARLYAAYAYECYLTNKIKEAIDYQEKVLDIFNEQEDNIKAGDCMRFLSRLNWYNGNKHKADEWGSRAIEALANQPACAEKAMALSNMAQLKMLADEPGACIFWGEQAIAMAEELDNKEILSHALNNVGTVLFESEGQSEKGYQMLRQSLDIALQNSYHEHAARAYTNFGSRAIKAKDYVFGLTILDEGINYCEERDLDSWSAYMLQCKAKLFLDTGRWDEAYAIASQLMQKQHMAAIVKIGALAIMASINLRRGSSEVLTLLATAKTLAFAAMELQRIIPVMAALLEYEWLTGKQVIEEADIDTTIQMAEHSGNSNETSELAYWLYKAKKQAITIEALHEGYDTRNREANVKAAALWQKLHCPYQQALCLFETGEDGKRQALAIMQKLGADAIYQKLKQGMREAGIKSIPRGERKTTKANPASLTEREVDVLKLLKRGMQDKEIASTLFISPKTVGHHISSILFKLEVNSRVKAVQEAEKIGVV